jgi:hypothetical protein
MNAVSQIRVEENALARRLRIVKSLRVFNRSGKDAKVIITPCPITSIKSVGHSYLGNYELETHGEYLPQEAPIRDGENHTFTLDNSQIYYTTLFKCKDEWKLHRKSIRLDASINDFVLLPRHANDTEYF